MSSISDNQIMDKDDLDHILKYLSTLFVSLQNQLQNLITFNYKFIIQISIFYENCLLSKILKKKYAKYNFN